MKLKQIFHSLIAKLGYIIVKPAQIEAMRNGDSMERALVSLKNKKNIQPSTIVDLGAAAGTWTEKAIRVWPESRFILFEPLEERAAELKALQKIHFKNVIEVQMGAVGSKNGEVILNVADDLDGSGIYEDASTSGRKVPLYCLNDSCRHLPAPYLLKLDTHGFEVPIFEGASEILAKTVAVVVEVYGFHISATALRFHEMTQYLEEKEFRLVDMVDIMRRPVDEVFWQADFVFLRKEHPVFLQNSYQ